MKHPRKKTHLVIDPAKEEPVHSSFGGQQRGLRCRVAKGIELTSRAERRGMSVSCGFQFNG
jgi:hypothetical protein